MNYDVFLIHASEDKEQVVDPLVQALEGTGITCWYDKKQIGWGEGIAKSINDGLGKAKYVIAVLSVAFLRKRWPQSEFYAVLNDQITTGKTRVLPLLVGTDDELQLITREFPLLNDRKFLRWTDGLEVVVNSMLARLSRLDVPADDKSPMLKQKCVRSKFTSVVFAAGKSMRMGRTATKMLLPIGHLGKTQAMLFHVVDLFMSMEIPVVVLVGFAGTTIIQELQKRYGALAPKTIRVAKDNGEDLMPNTAGTLRKYRDEILKKTGPSEYILFTVGDQPYMRADSINEFILDLLETSYQAGILLADATGTELENSTSTRVSITGDRRISFATPTRESRWELHSNLLDVGVLILHRKLFHETASRIEESVVFSRLLENLPEGENTFLAKIETDILQFRNVNSIIDIPVDTHIEATASESARQIDPSLMLLDWLRWNHAGRPKGNEAFHVFDYSRDFPIFCEIDTTTVCKGTLGCTPHCTYREKHTKDTVLGYDCGHYFLDKAAELGVRGVLFSGGGENLEDCSYNRFLSLLKYAKQERRLHTSLATNGRYLTLDRMQELSLYLDSLRISIPPIRDDYCHAGLVAPSVTCLRKIISSISGFRTDIGVGKYEPMKVIVNILMSPEMPQSELEALIRMYSQMGVDGIRLKPMHEFQRDRTFTVRADAYRGHLETIRSLVSDERLKRPEVTVAKLEGMLAHEKALRNLPRHCWYRDFNPLVLGADGHLYACCEMKYEKPPFDKGQLSPEEDNLMNLLSEEQMPHPITKEHCFRGCKGYLPNNDLQLLLDRYVDWGEAIFDHSESVVIRNRVLASLPRTVLGN